MPNSQPPGVVGPFAGLDVPWLLRMRAETRRDHPFLIWAPFDAPAPQMELRRIPRPRRRAGRGARRARHKTRRIRADPSRQLHRGDAGLVRLRRTRRHRRHHQHPLRACRDGVFCRSLRRGRRDHPARLCRDDLGALPGLALDRGDFARRGRRARASPATRRRLRVVVRRQRRPSAPRHRSIRALQRAIYLRHHVAAEGGAVDPCQRAVGRQGQRRASGSARRRRAPDLFAAVPHQRAGLFDAGKPVGRRLLRDPAAVFREPVLERRRRARLHLDLDHPVLHEGAAGARDPEAAHVSGSGAPRSASRRPSPRSASKSSAGGA